MKKMSGLFLLLFAFLLVAMPAAAADLVSVDAWLILGESETESAIREEVTETSLGESLAVPAAISEPAAIEKSINHFPVIVPAGYLMVAREAEVLIYSAPG